MQTSLSPSILNTDYGKEADRVLRSCVHCGFCTATCPTYQLLGDELDSPRGRIYQIKELLEGAPVTDSVRTHLDRCLTCLACETVCPSGVDYAELLEVGRTLVERGGQRPFWQKLQRQALLHLVPFNRRFASLARLGNLAAPLLPASLKAKIPRPAKQSPRPAARHARRMLMLEGCVQPTLSPSINEATARVLDKLGISLVSTPDAGCCGALPQHLSEEQKTETMIRRNIDAWWPEIDAGAEAIVTTASACGVTIKDYERIMSKDPAYAEKAARISSLTKDIVEILREEDLSILEISPDKQEPIAFHAPCSLQHGSKLKGAVEELLADLGYTLTPVRDAHLCCGSAGTYSLFQPEIANQLRSNKLEALQAEEPTLIATANIGCLNFLQEKANRPVKHWIELLDQATNSN